MHIRGTKIYDSIPEQTGKEIGSRQPRKISHLPAKTVKSVTAPATVTSKIKKSKLSSPATQVEEISLLFLGTW